MQIARTILIAVLAVMVFHVLGCNMLALTGPKKYKAGLSSIIMQAKDELETSETSERTVEKLNRFLDANRDEFGDYASFQHTEELADLMQKMRDAEQQDKFPIRREIESKFVTIEGFLTTEIAD